MQLKERVFFTRYFAILLSAGLTIKQSLQILRDQLTAPIWQKVLPSMAKSIENGHTLSEALEKYPKDFPPFYSKMVAVGEKSGNLAKVFSYLQAQLQKDWRIVSKVKRAFIYPVVILSILLVVSVGLIVLIVPKVAKLFVQLKIELPLPTRILIFLQQFIQNNGIFVLIGVVVLIFALRALFTIGPVKFQLHKFILHVPLFGKIVRNLNLARFSQILATLLAGGVPLVNSLAIASATVSNLVFKEAIARARDAVESGDSLSKTLQNNPSIFPPLTNHMIGIGEKTGNLQGQSRELARFYALEVNSSIKTLSSLIEPLLLIFVAAGVGSIALSIILPLYQLPAAIHK